MLLVPSQLASPRIPHCQLTAALSHASCTVWCVSQLGGWRDSAYGITWLRHASANEPASPSKRAL